MGELLFRPARGRKSQVAFAEAVTAKPGSELLKDDRKKAPDLARVSIGRDQYRIVVRRPKTAAFFTAAPVGSRGLETLPPGRNTYWKSG